MRALDDHGSPPSDADRAAGAALVARIALGEQAAALVRAAAQSGLFTAVEWPASADAVAAALGIEPAQAADACAAMVALGLMDEADGRFRLSPGMVAVLSADAPQSLAATLGWSAATARTLAGALRPPSGRTPSSPDDRLAVAAAVWGRAESPLAMASFAAVDAAMPEALAVWRAGARHLELGCGAGRDLLRLAVPYPATRVVGVDLDGLVLAEVRRQAQAIGVADRVAVWEGDARAFDDPAGFDTVTWSQMFFPAGSRAATIATLHRVMKLGALLILPLIQPAPVAQPGDRPGDQPGDRSDGGLQPRIATLLWRARGVVPLSEAEVRSELEAQGFGFIRTVPHRRTPYMLMRRGSG